MIVLKDRLTPNEGVTMNPLSLGDRKRPTQKHRVAIWEGILGTVYAANAAGDVKYCDYRYDEAIEWAELEGADLRTYRYTKAPCSEGPRRGQIVLWAKREV